LTSSYSDKLNTRPQSSIAKKDTADSGTSRVQEVALLLLKSKVQKKVSKKLFIDAETSRSVGTE
jgi:hypothetical protein